MKKSICSFLVLLFCAQCSLLKAQPYAYPFQNPDLPVEERVNDLVGRLTLPEKIAQMMNGSPAIGRLGILAYNWWNEGLHGLARTQKGTVFPQAVGMAATFDTEAILKTAEIISDEARATYHYAVANNGIGRYRCLTLWSPNINIFRDPRWGRGQETYGEDPYLSGELGVAYVKGLQGDDPKYFKTIATPKHYAVHSGPEYLRHVFDAKPPLRDLWETYLPAFEKLITEGKAYSIMCAYNALEGYPCCASNKLLVDILRNKWKFDGVVVSDCGAIGDFFMNHGYSADEANAAAAGVKAGTDLECGSRYNGLTKAIQDGLITEAEIDVSLKRNFTARMKLGLFDPNDRVSYSQIPYSNIDLPEHREHALEIARKSIVLLKNDNNTLPFKKDIKTIAVMGPNADSPTCLLGNYKGSPPYNITPLDGIRKKAEENGIDVIYERGTGHTNNIKFMPVDISDWLSIDGKQGMFKAEYYKSSSFTGAVAKTQYEKDVYLFGEEVHQTLTDFGVYPWSIGVRWTTYLTVPENDEDCGESISFEMECSDWGFRLLIDDYNAMDFDSREVRVERYQFQAKAGKTYRITFEGRQSPLCPGGGIRMILGKQTKSNPQEIIKKIEPADAIVFVGGISPILEGEELGTNEPGFKRGDRTTINLPESQTELLKALATTGKPIVLVMMTGSALTVNWEKENLPAIITSWYGGQDGGTALADVLFGDYNPAGRLPVTVYASDDDLPDFEDYSMKGRTYRYFTGKPLFEFGYGLSYTQFAYSGLIVPVTASTNENITVKATVTNTGALAGEEVVQLYISHQGVANAPLRSLQGFKRIFLNTGESKQVEFTLTHKQLVVFDDVLAKRCVVPGTISVSVGGRQPSEEAILNNAVLRKTVELTGGKNIID